MTIEKKIEEIVNQYHLINNSDFQKYNLVINDIKKKYSILPKDRPRKTTFLDIINKTFDENYISDFLAFILNPIKNGLGFLPIKYLIDSYVDNIESFSFNDITIQREFTFSDLSRIDILIELPYNEMVIAIENKIFSKEGYNQTKKYEQNLLRLYPDKEIICFYLSPFPKSNLTSSLFNWITYKDLYDKLSQITIDKFYELDSFKFYQDFLVHINEKFTKNMEIKLSEKSRLYFANNEIIDDIVKSATNDAYQYFNFVIQITKDYYDEKGADWKMSFNPERGWQQIQKNNWIKPDLNIHFEFWFNKLSLITSNEIAFMIEVEGKNASKFLTNIELNSKLLSEIKQNGFLFRPSNRKHAVCFNSFKLDKRLFEMQSDDVQNLFCDFYDKFDFVIEYIDNEIIKFA